MADNTALGLLSASTVPREIWRLLEHWHIPRKINFTQAYPRERVDGPTIVWRIISRVPGKEGKETRKPRLRTAIQDNQQIIHYEAQWMTINYQFDIYEVSAEAVDSLAEEWDSIIGSTVPFLMEKGVEHFMFSQQLQDDTLGYMRQDELYVHSFRYMCILPYYYVNTKQAIRDIYINTESDPDYEVKTIVRGTGVYDNYPEPYLDKIYSVYQLIENSERKFFTPNVDFRVLSQKDGTFQLYWLQYGAQPEAGEEYIVEASRFKKVETFSSLGDDTPL